MPSATEAVCYFPKPNRIDFPNLKSCAKQQSSANMAHQSLRERQVAALKKVLNFNQDVKEESDQDKALARQAPTSSAASAAEPEILWKILVFDPMGSDVLSTVLRVSDLRSL